MEGVFQVFVVQQRKFSFVVFVSDLESHVYEL